KPPGPVGAGGGRAPMCGARLREEAGRRGAGGSESWGRRAAAGGKGGRGGRGRRRLASGAVSRRLFRRVGVVVLLGASVQALRRFMRQQQSTPEPAPPRPGSSPESKASA